MADIRIPNAVADITADWLTGVLADKFPGTVVTSAAHGTVINGTATKVRLLLDYNDAGHAHRLPATMWFKGGLEAHSLNADQLAVYAGESAFYRDLAFAIDDLGCPRGYLGYVEPVSNRSMLLMEDLLASNARFGHATRPLSLDAAARVIELLARLHARFWNSAELNHLEWLQGGGPLLKGGVIDVLWTPAVWERCSNLPRGKFLTGPLRDFPRLRKTMLHMLEHDAGNAHCLLHGDAHLGNLYFDQEGTPGYLDWQTSMLGFWAHDVSDFITTSLVIEDRRHGERDLIRLYVEQLAQRGVDLAYDTAWDEYRRHALYNLTWVMCLPEWQPEEVCFPNAERACAAALDLQTLDAW